MRKQLSSTIATISFTLTLLMGQAEAARIVSNLGAPVDGANTLTGGPQVAYSYAQESTSEPKACH
jgi:hypothetical protein